MNEASAQRVDLALRAAGVWLLMVSAVAAQSYAGTYSAEPAEITRNVASWPKECGAQPNLVSAADRPLVQVSQVGAHLWIQFPNRRVRTDACFRASPGVSLAASTIGKERWDVECRSEKNAATQEISRYRVEARGPHVLEVIEETDQAFLSGSTQCKASVRSVQKLERIPAERAASAADKARVGEGPCFPGPPTKLRMRPNQARIEPGQRVCFSLVGLDDASCPSEVSSDGLKWELRKPEAARAVLLDGCFRAAPNAAEAEGTFRVIATYGTLRGESEVTVRAPDLSDITAQRGAASGSSPALEQTSAPGSPQNVTSAGVRAAALKRDSLPVWLAAGAFGLVALGAGLWLGLRNKARSQPVGAAREPRRPSSTPPKQRAAARPNSESERRSPLPAAPERRSPLPAAPERRSPLPAAPEPRSPVPSESGAKNPAPAAMPARAKEAAPMFMASEPMICPTCRHGFAPGSTTCSKDGAALMPYAEFVKLSSARHGAPKSCPKCKAVSASDSLFCGECGTRLPS